MAYPKTEKTFTYGGLLLMQFRDLGFIATNFATSPIPPNQVLNYRNGLIYLDRLLQPFWTDQYIERRNDFLKKLNMLDVNKNPQWYYELLQEWFGWITEMCHANRLLNYSTSGSSWEEYEEGQAEEGD